MLARILPPFLLCACATTAPLPMTEQPGLALLARPYAEQLRLVGITRVISPGNGAMVRLETSYGPVYVRYPSGSPDAAFALDVGTAGLQAASANFDRQQEEQMLATLLPQAARVT